MGLAIQLALHGDIDQYVLEHIKSRLDSINVFKVSLRGSIINLRTDERLQDAFLLAQEMRKLGHESRCDVLLLVTSYRVNDHWGRPMFGALIDFEETPKVALVSGFRLRYGLSRLEAFLSRISKETIHEIGHSIGLGHCVIPRCVMHPSLTLEHVDRKSSRFCPVCIARISIGKVKGLLRRR